MENELLPVKRTITPEVIDETGKKIVGPEMEAVTKMVTQFAQLAQLARIRKSLEREQFEGKEDPRTLDANDELQALSLIDDFPYTPWVSVYFINDGPDPVKISTNRPYAQFTMKKRETVVIDRSHAEERIRLIYYVCDPGETATVRATGQY